MKSVTEFFTFKLLKGIEAKTALTAEGKSPEEVEQSIGETFKLEGDKLKYFFNSLDVASENLDKLTRVLVVSLDESEKVPPQAVKVEDHYYVPEFQKTLTPTEPKQVAKGGGGNRNKGKRKDGPKSSPWGITPEELAAKKAGKGKGKEKEKTK